MLHTWLPPDNPARRQPKARPMAMSGDRPPTSYDLTGAGVWVAYFPDGLGSVPSADAARLFYRDAHGTRTFGSREIDTTVAAGLGTVITVALDRGPDTTQSFSLILPRFEAHATGLPKSLRTVAVTTVHRASVRTPGHPSGETYAVTTLTGQAVGGPTGTELHHGLKVTPRGSRSNSRPYCPRCLQLRLAT